jgi:hypothetical protein
VAGGLSHRWFSSFPLPENKCDKCRRVTSNLCSKVDGLHSIERYCKERHAKLQQHNLGTCASSAAKALHTDHAKILGPMSARLPDVEAFHRLVLSWGRKQCQAELRASASIALEHGRTGRAPCTLPHANRKHKLCLPAWRTVPRSS